MNRKYNSKISIDSKHKANYLINIDNLERLKFQQQQQQQNKLP